MALGPEPKYGGGVACRSAPGVSCSVPPMPRIQDAYLDCAVYLYASSPDAEAGIKTGGSGFLVGVPSERDPHYVYVFVVTNKHVVERGSTVIRVNTEDNGLGIWDTSETNWIFHPKGDDLALCRIAIKNTQRYNINFVSKRSLLTKETVDRLNIGPGDDTFLIGRFINHEGRQTNLPTVRFGSIAQMPIEPIMQDDQFLQESFLVETKTVAGYSGSPVFVYIPGMTEREGVEGWYPPANFMEIENLSDYGFHRSHGPWLLGVEWGHINHWTSVCRSNGAPVNPASPSDMQVRVNTGMSGVIPAWKLSEMLDEGPAAEAMKRHSEKLRPNPPSAGET